MTDAASMGILRDVFALGMIALCIAIPLYAYIRHKTGQYWYQDGKVLASPYDAGDGVVALILIGFFAFALFDGAPGAHGGAPGPDAKQEPGMSITMLVMSEFLLMGVAFSVLAYLALFRGLNIIELFGLRRVRPLKVLLQAFLWVVGAILCVIALQYFIQGFIPEDSPQQENVTAYRDGGIVFKVLLAASAVFVAPLIEELIFRGFVYAIVKRFTERRFATVFSALMFAVVHNNVASLFPLMLLACFLAIAYESSGSLLVPMCMHAMFNLWNLAVMTIEKSAWLTWVKMPW